jgi:multisubunit Na+/H+ antiporter MnhF subunit
MNMILGLLMAAVFVYIGVNMQPGMNTTIATITTPTYSAGVVGLNGVIMIVFASMIIFGIVKQMSATAA